MKREFHRARQAGRWQLQRAETDAPSHGAMELWSPGALAVPSPTPSGILRASLAKRAWRFRGAASILPKGAS